MSCCDDCKEGPIGKTSGGAVINFGEQDVIRDALKGSCFELTGYYIRDSKGAMTREDLYIRMTNLGKTYNVSIYEKSLPFDTLVATLQFDPTTGETATKAYRQITWTTVELHFNYVPIKTQNWKRIGPTMFRVRNHAGMIEVLEHYSAKTTTPGKRILEYVKDNSHPSKWPMFLMMVGQKEFELRVAEALDIPNWKDDAAWK